MSLLLILTAHLIADFFLQSAGWAQKKTQKFRYLVGHALVYAVVLAIAMFPCIPVGVAWSPFAVIAGSHFLIDWIRVLLDKKYKTPAAHFASFIVDQILHISIIVVLVYILGLNTQNNRWLSELASGAPVEQILRYVLLFAIVLDPASVFVKKLSLYVSNSVNSTTSKKELPVGSVIGKLERIIIAVLTIYGEIGAIGFVLAAKSLARYSKLDKDPDFAEKYLVGTLSSAAIAIIAALLLK